MKRILFLAATASFVFLLFAAPAISQVSNKNAKTESIEDWETGDFSQFEWQFGGNADWTITELEPYEGTYSAQSGFITHSQVSQLILEYNVYDEEVLSFWYKVSSESNWDYLKFYVDGTLMEEWSGIIPWSLAEYTIPVGIHTFMWEYYKDGSVSTGSDACWIDYITFPPEEIEANFMADTTVICQTDVVFFTDLSIGPVTEWSWIFEGAVPGSSTEQNPVVAYPNVGSWDVFLEVSDGNESSTLYMQGYINVSATPDAAITPMGISSLCASWGNTTYNTTAMGGDVTSYDWQLDPPEAGTISGNGGTNVTVIWEDGFLGEIDLSVAGINYCGIGTYSAPLTITRYLPDVSLTVPGWVALPEPPFELTGGSPSGGEYSGTGVSNGWFDPMAAGMGPHTITYTYTDVNFCTNSAEAVITVTEFIGIDEATAGLEMSVYPNPNSGNFIVQLNTDIMEIATINVYNTTNEIVYMEENVNMGNSYQKNLNLSELSNGIYFLKISGAKKEYFRKIIIRK